MTRVIRTTYHLLEQTIILITAIIFTALTFAGCTSDSALTEGHGGGEPAILHLTFTIADGPISRALSTSNENTVNDLTVLIFNSNHDLIGSKYATSVTQMDVDTRQATGCTVCAIANTGSSSYFAGINTLDQLNAMYTTKMSSAADLGNGSNCLMYGSKGPVSITGGTQIALTLAHVCSKMSLSIVPAAGITITGYQLCNTSMGSYLTDSHSAVTACPVGYDNFAAVSGLTSTSTVNATYYLYENLAGSNSASNTEALRTSTNAMANSTYLLVYAKTSSWHSTYKIYLGGVTKSTPPVTPTTDYTDYNIYRNYNYACTVNINGGGSGDARVTYMADIPPTLKQFLFSDGTYGKISDNPGKTPIAIVFCITPSTADKAKNYHGYALALKNASTSSTWGPTTTTPTGAASTTLNITDYDGLTYTGMINNSTYPAAYAAATTFKSTVPNPSGTSGWYLPSIGQWYQICVNLGGMSTSFTDYRTSGYLYWAGQSTACANAINTAMSEAGSGKYDEFSAAANQYYWSSSEYEAYGAYGALFNSGGYMSLGKSGKGGGYYVRPVIAF
jgi:hypothetical protein